jgi:hypothetical protein
LFVLLPLLALSQSWWSGRAQRVGGLQIHDVDNTVALEDWFRGVRVHADAGDEWTGPQMPLVPWEGNQKWNPALLLSSVLLLVELDEQGSAP